jgi:hypothetical protein
MLKTGIEFIALTGMMMLAALPARREASVAPTKAADGVE